MDLKNCKKQLGSAAIVLLILSGCAFSQKAPAQWTFDVENASGGCLYNISYVWKKEIPGRISDKIPKFCGKGSGLDAHDRIFSQEPFEIQWTNSQGAKVSKVLDMVKILKGQDLYGGSLSIVLTQNTVQVWLAPPNREKENRFHVYPNKAKSMIFESQ